MATGANFTETKAGKINKETYLGLSDADKAALAEFSGSMNEAKRATINAVFTYLSGV